MRTPPYSSAERGGDPYGLARETSAWKTRARVRSQPDRGRDSLWMLHAALTAERARVDARQPPCVLLEGSGVRGATRPPAPAATASTTTREIIRAATSGPRVAGRMLANGLRAVVMPVRPRLTVDRWHAVKLLHRPRDRDVEILLILGRREALLDTLRASGLLPRLQRWPNLRIRVIADGDHRSARPSCSDRYTPSSTRRSSKCSIGAGTLRPRARPSPRKRMYELTPSDGRADDYLRWRRWRTRRLPAHIDPQPWRGMPAQRLLRAVRPDRTAARNLTTS